jgi:L-alanine-DL-glutamate epimerase-like enolase superfamily enzyme
VTRSRLEPFSLPLSEPLETADGSTDAREGFLLRVGAGLGEAAPLPGWTESRPACRAALEAAVTALDSPIPDREAALAACEGAPAARHAVALALADRAARCDAVPLAERFGGVARERIRVNATLGDAAPEATAERARTARRRGFECLKVKVGARSVAADRERMRAVREAAPEATLRADANGAWDRAEARAAFDALADLGVAYVEQPLPAADLEGLAALRGRGVGVAADESVALRGSDEVLDADAADVLVLKPMALGGPGRVRAAAEQTTTEDAAAVVTTTVDGAVARAGAVHLAATFEGPPCGVATADLLARDLAADPAPVADGAVRLPPGNGLGIPTDGVEVP